MLRFVRKDLTVGLYKTVLLSYRIKIFRHMELVFILALVFFEKEFKCLHQPATTHLDVGKKHLKWRSERTIFHEFHSNQQKYSTFIFCDNLPSFLDKTYERIWNPFRTLAKIRSYLSHIIHAHYHGPCLHLILTILDRRSRSFLSIFREDQAIQ